MGSCRSRFILSLVLIFISFIDVKSQEKKKVSINLMSGVVFFPKNQKIPSYGMLPANIFGGYAFSGMAGLGLNYSLSKKTTLFENLTFLTSVKKNYSLSAATFKTGLKYNILSDKKISPFVFGSVDLSFMFLNRKQNSTSYYLDSTANTIGSGYGGTQITYNEERLNLSFVPVAGGSVGAGVNVKLSNKTSFFLAYSYNTALASRSHIIKENYFNNKSDFSYSMINAGLTIYFLKNTKQLLASLGKEEWEGDKTVSVKGTIIYHKNKKSNNKIIPVELTNVKDSTLKIIPSGKEGVFMIKDLTSNDYKFMLEKKNRKIKKADLEIIHDHRKVKVVEEFIPLEMFDDFESENLISRDGNFSVVLREGFQHEIDLTITGMSINGKLNNVAPDTSCNDIDVLLYNKEDSLIKGVPAGNDCSFSLIDLDPGQYKMVLRNGKEKGKVSFDYQFTEAIPDITRQVNNISPKITYFIIGKVYVEDSANAKNIDLHLVDKYNRVIEKTSFIPPGEFIFDGLASGDYQIDYELTDKNAKGKINYTVLADNSSFRKEYTCYFGKPANDFQAKLKAKGQILNSLSKPSEGVDVYLVDPSHQIMEKTNTDKDGYFHFDKLPSKDYKIAYSVSDSTLKTDLKYNIVDENNNVVEDDPVGDVVIASASATKKMSLQNKLKTGNSEVSNDGKQQIQTLASGIKNKNVINYNDFKIHNTYSPEGEIVHPQGFGVQVGSFKLVANLKHYIVYLKQNGYKDIFIQVVTLDLKNKSEKLYRVVLGKFEDLNELREWEEKLKTSGFTTVYRKHI
jgi:cell division septation protein DedD